jgi:glycosyltransferase involved in cell wall biosynthesis
MSCFSILLPVYKAQYLRECIDSIIAQTYTDWELIIINDASPEPIDAIISTYSDPRIRYYVNETNIGGKDLVRQWNTCLVEAKGDYCICIGDDDKMMPSCLTIYAKYIEKYPFAEIIHGQTDIIDEQGEFVCHTTARPEWESAMSLLYHRTYNYKHQFIGDFCYASHPLKEQGGFYALPLAWGSDDISAIIAAQKEGIVNTSEVVFLYRIHRNTISKQSHTWSKLRAILLEAKWKWDFLRNKQNNQQDEHYRLVLRKGLVRHTLRKMYYVLHHALYTKRKNE